MKEQLFSSNRHTVPNKAIHATKNLEKNRRTCTAIKQSRVGIFNKYSTKWIGFGSQMGLASKKKRSCNIPK